MVFESVVVDLLNRFLGDYVENLNSNQLRVGIWGGDVVLENLSLKPNVLQELDLPLKIAFGNLGKLCLKIPWQNLYSAPVIVSVERLFLILVPSQEVRYDAAREEKWAQDVKKAALQKFEDAKKRELEKDIPKPDDTFIEKLAVNIIKNVQIKIVDIHIRYEDRITTVGQTFGLGLTLHNLSIQTTNAKWEETFVDSKTDQFFKLLNLDGLAVYWNCNSRLIWSESTTFDAIQSQCKKGIYTQDLTPPGYHYILGPINSSIKMLMNPKPEVTKFSQPKITILWGLQSLSIGISKSQYQDLINLMESMDRGIRGSPFRKYRPNLSVYRGHYKAWWKFAFTCILEEDVRRVRQNWSWEKILKHRVRCQKYAISYRKKITTKKPNDETLRTCADLEKYMDVLNIILVRQRVEMEVATTEQAAVALKKPDAGWFGGWFGGAGSSKQDSDSMSAAAIAKKFETAMTPEEKRKLFKAIDYEENAGKANYPETYVELSVSFSLPALFIEIRDDIYDSPRVLFAELKGVEFSFGNRPAVSGITLHMMISQLTVFGMQQGAILPQLVVSKGLEPQGAHLLTLLVEISPNDKLCDQRVHLFSRPLEIVFDAGTINKVTDVFKPPEQSHAISQLQAAANVKLKNFKEMSALGLQYAIDNHVTLDLNVDLQSSYILIPYRGLYRGKEDLIVINLGHISMKSIIRDKEMPNIAELHKAGTSEDDILRRMMAQSYDQFVIRVEDVQILMSRIGEDWKNTLSLVGRNTQLHMLTPTSLVVNLARCLITDDLRMPKVKIEVILPSVSLLLADERLLHLLAVLSSLNIASEDELELATNETGSRRSSLSQSTKVDLPDMTKRRDMKPWLKLKTTELKKNNSELMAAQVTNLEMKFELPDFHVSLHRIRKQKQGIADLDASNRMLLFRLMKTEVHMVQSNMHMEVCLRLGGVTFDAPDSSGDVRLLDTPLSGKDEGFLFSVVYKKVTKISPTTNRHQDEQFVVVTFTKLNVHLHQEALVILMVYGQAFSQQMEATMNPPSAVMKPSVHHTLPILEEGEILGAIPKPAIKPRTKQRARKLDVMEVFFRFKASMETFNITILTGRKIISQISIEGCFAEMIFRHAQTEIIARLKNFTVEDRNPVTDHRRIVSIVGDEMMLAQVILYNNEMIRESNAQSPDIFVTADIACIRFVYVNNFVSTLLRFLSSFQEAKERMVEAAVEAAYIAKQNIQEAKTSKISLAVNFQAPLIILPINLRSASALVLDFGKLSIINKIALVPGEHENDDSKIAIVDEMTIGLENLKISRVKLHRDYSIKNECPLLQPVTFNIEVTRNLSAPWYTDIADVRVEGKLEDFHMMLTEEDLKMIMRVLSENLGSVDESEFFDQAIAPPMPPGNQPSVSRSKKSMDLQLKDRAYKASASRADSERTTRTESTRVVTVSSRVLTEVETLPKVDTDTLRLDFTMNNCILDLFNGGIRNLDDEGVKYEADSKNSLGRFSVHDLSTQCAMTASGNMTASVWLANCLLEDTRLTHCGQLTRLMQRKDTTASSTGDAYFKNMMHIDYRAEKEETILEMRVYSFELILSLEYLMRLSAFIKNSFGGNSEMTRNDSHMSLSSIKPSSTKTRSSNLSRKSGKSLPVKVQEPAAAPKMMTINIILEKPDIILVESVADTDTNCLILNCELGSKIRMIADHQVINASLENLQLYSCCYNPLLRDSSKALILHPCNIFVAGSTPADAGLHLDVNLSDIRLGVSPGTIEILNRVYQAVYGSVATTSDQVGQEADYTHLWAHEEYGHEDFWFIKPEMGQDVMEMSSMSGQSDMEMNVKAFKKEVCIVMVPLIAITVEAGVGKQTLPMVKIDMSMNSVARNWSSELELENTVCLKMSYYNSRLALWEPLIEPVENKDNQERPWSMKLSMMSTKPATDASPDTDATTGDEIITPPPKNSVNIVSDDSIELTITKTSISVFSQLAEAFQNAVTSEGWSQKTALKAPFVVKNDTGVPILIQLQDSPFLPQDVAAVGQDYAQVLLHAGTELHLALKLKREDPSDVQWNAIKQVRRDSDDQSQQLKAREMFLNVQMVNGKSWLRLAVVRAEKRYFDLQHRGEDKEPWGLVSHVKVIAGSSLITLRGILQITNHFHVAVNVYYMTPRGNELECVGTIEPDSDLNLPLSAIYTLTGELFFSVSRYTVSVKPFVWKALKNEVVASELLQCLPKPGSTNETAPFFMKVVGEMEQVYYEHTMRHNMQSTLYNIHLRPAVVLKNLLPVDIGVKLDKGIAVRRVHAGEGIQLPTAEPGVTSLTIEILRYLDKDWICTQPVQWNAPPFTTCSFVSRDSFSKVILDLGIHTDNKNSTTTMAIYCPFWMINKTGLSLAYRSEEAANILSHPKDYSGPILFSFKAKSFFGKKKAAVRVSDGDWSDKFSLDVAGSSGIIRCKNNGIDHQIGVNIQLTHFTLTKEVTFTPFYVLINNSKLTIQVQEAERPADPWTEIAPGSCTPMWPVNDKDKDLRLRVAGTKEVTVPFSYAAPHTTLLRLANSYGGVNVDVQITDSSIYVSMCMYAPGLAPVLLVNHTTRPVKFKEKGKDKGKDKNKEPISILMPGHMTLMTWLHSLGPRRLTWNLGYDEVTFDMRQDGIGEYKQNVMDAECYWVSFLDGIQRVLLFTDEPAVASRAHSSASLETPDQEISLSFAGLGISLVNNSTLSEVLYISIASSGIAWETRKSARKPFKPLSQHDSILIEAAYQKYNIAMSITEQPGKHLYRQVILGPNLEVDFMSSAMIRPVAQPLRRTHYVGLWVQLQTSPHQLQLHAKINRIQMDCQIADSVFPVVLAPVPPPKSVALKSVVKPFAEVSIVRRISEHSSLQQYKYFKFLIQEFHIKLDIGLVNALVDLLEPKETTEAEEAALFLKDRALINEPLMAHVSMKAYQEQKNFYDFLHFSPLKIHLSFSLASSGHKGRQEMPAFLNVLMQSLGVTLTDVQDVIFKLGYFEREHTFLTHYQLVSAASSHYISQAVKQLYVLVLGLDVLGNPYGLVLGLTQGVEDLFYEPFQGAIQGPGEFAEGLVLGMRSLLGHTVGGAAGAASRITGAMGKGLAALTFDKDYQRKRREAMNQRHTNVQSGLAQSSKGLVMGVVDGVSGVFTKPISGAREDGVAGFFTGMGKGVMGLVTRPTAGVIDFASGSLDAVKRATELNEEVVRRRLPRFFHVDGLIRPYSTNDARGNKILHDLEKGRYIPTDVYFCHVDIGKDTLMLTDQRLMFISHGDMFGSSLAWSYTWESLKVPPRHAEDGIYVAPPPEERTRVLGIFGSSEVETKFIPIADKQTKDWVFLKMMTHLTPEK